LRKSNEPAAQDGFQLEYRFMSLALVKMVIENEQDIVFARQRARQIAVLLGFDNSTQVRIATAVSEIARNAFVYAGGGSITFHIEGKTIPQLLEIVVSDVGQGISNLDTILGGGYKSSTGMGMGMIGSKRLMDSFNVETSKSGTTVRLGKLLPLSAPLIDNTVLATITKALAQAPNRNAISELQHQNKELITTLDEIRKQKEELSSINGELQDTNRGVVALYAELDERAEYLKRADDMKSRFLSNMSHEFRTPLNSTIALARLLLNRADGDLTPEQEKQVQFIQKNAFDLSQLVDDLLDLAKIEAGRVTLRPSNVNLNILFSTLRGMLRPLLVHPTVDLLFEIPDEFPTFISDESKISQILRNFISNAIKFTENGLITVKASQYGDDSIILSVADTGIGIPQDEQSKIFSEFHQVENVLQKKYKGTGLGLPLSRKLAGLLKGRIEFSSEAGKGSTFSLILPMTFNVEEVVESPQGNIIRTPVTDTSIIVLCVEDSEEYIHIYSKYLMNTSFKLVVAKTLFQARRILDKMTPAAIILDINLEGEDSWHFISDLRNSGHTSAIPIVVCSVIDGGGKAIALGANACAIKPVERDWLIGKLEALTRLSTSKKVLIVDDDDAFRYTVKSMLEPKGYFILESRNGADAINQTAIKHPDVLLLDIGLPGLTGFDVTRQIRFTSHGKNLAIVMTSGRELDASERDFLETQRLLYISKDEVLRTDRESSLERMLLSQFARARAERCGEVK